MKPAAWRAARDQPLDPVSREEGFRPFEHTGDLGLEVWAASAERLFALAAEALSAQIAEARPLPAEFRVDVVLEGDGPEDLLVHWLNTALLEGELRRAVWTRADVSLLTTARIEGTLSGQRLDPRRQTFLREIKAVSMHGLALELEASRCRCRLILDV